MNKKEKKKKQSRKKRREEDDDEIDDGLKQSKISFVKIEDSEEEKSKKSDSNSKEKFLLIDEKDLKNGSKNKTKKDKKKEKEKPKKKRGRPKSESKGSKSSKSSSKSNSKKKTKSKSKKVKIKKGVDYVKGKYNIRVELIENDNNLEGEENSVNNSCCVVCSNRNCVRAAYTKNYKLMKNCINDREHISTLINPYSVSIGNAIEIAIKNDDKKIIEMIFNSWNDDEDPKKRKDPRCFIEKPKIQLVNTGENSVYMVGVKTRKLNQTRGNKMGNDAFIRDDVCTNKYDIATIICKYITEKCDDPSFIDFIKSLQFGKDNNFDNNIGNNNMNNNFNNNRYYNNSNNFNFTFESYIINAVLKGNIEISKHLLKDLDQNYNFGFNALHYNVLGENNADNLTVKVKTSLTKKPQTNYGMTPMHVVCINPDVSFIQKMIELGADWNILDDLNRKPIHYAACCKEAGPINYLISLGALINEVDKEKKSPLMYACMSGRLECVKALLRKDANFLLKDKILKNTAFHFACKFGYADIVEYFLENTDIKVDLPGEERMTGLMLASLYGHFDLVEYLIEHKAKVTKKDKFKRTPLLHAVRGGQLKIASYLITKGAEYDLPDSSNNTPLHYACSSGFKEIAELLLNAGASPNPSNDWKYTPLEIGFLKNHLGIVKFLLDYVDVNTKFNLDMCLIHYSFKKITNKVVDEEMKYLIIDKSCDINTQDYYGEGIIHYLANFTYEKYRQDNSDYINELFRYNNRITYKEKEQKCREMYKKLLKKIFNLLNQRKNLDINLVNKKGITAFQISIEKNNFDFIEEILKLNPQLCFIDQKGNSVFHCLVPFIFENKIPTDKKAYVIKEILDRLKDNISDDELNRISNSYDENGFTPLLKLMYEYYKSINRVFEDIKNEESYEYKKEKLQYDIANEENQEQLDNKISTLILNEKDINEIHNKSMKKFHIFIDFLLSVIKYFISLKMNPLIKVGKLAVYRNSPTNIENRIDINDKKNKKLSKNRRIESLYFQGQGKNSILLYLMRYPSKIILEYFIKKLKIPVNIYNLYKRNSLYFLFDSINQIYSKEKNNNLIIDTLLYLIKEGINLEQIDYLGNNPFLYLAMNNFNENILSILLNNKCDINKFNKDDNNSLFFYIRRKNLNIVKRLIEYFNVDYTLTDSKRRTIMHYICNDEVSSTDMDERLCDYILSKKINLNQPDILGRTPLHYLFVKINDEYNNNNIDPVNTLTKLLEYEEVDPEHKDIFGNTPLHYACQRGSIISIISLGAKKIDYDAKNNENNSPLAYSFLFKKENIAISLIQQNVNLDQYAYPLKERNEKNYIENLEKNKNKSLITVLTNKINEQANKKSDIDLDTSFVGLESDEDSTFYNIKNKINKNNKIDNKDKNNNNKIIEENEEDLLEKQNDEINTGKNIDNNEEEEKEKEEEEKEEEENEEDDISDNSDHSFQSGNNNYNRRQLNNYNKRGILLLPNRRNNIIINRRNNFNNNFNNNNNNSQNLMIPNYISNLFKDNQKGIQLFRLCIKNNFQGLTHLFITRGYGLMKAVEDSFYEQKFNLAMKLLIRSPYNKTYQVLNSDGQNLFHILGHINKIQYSGELPQFLNILYSKEIPLDSKDNFGNTPLHYAAKNLFIEFIKFIINKYSNKSILDIKNNDNYTPLILSMKGNNINSLNKDIFDLLFTNKDINQLYEEDEKIINNLNNKSNYKCSLLIFVVRKMLQIPDAISDKKSNLKYFYTKLIQNGASVMEKDSYGRTCLIYAVLENNLPFLKMLCKDAGKKIDKNIVDNNGKSLVHYCVSLNNFGSYENEEMLNYLLENDFLSTSKDNLNKTPLDYALEQKSLINLKILKNNNIPGTQKININGNNYKNNKDEIDEKKANSIPIVDFEKDSEEYYNKQLNLAPPSRRIKKPNLPDYKSEFFELYKENDEYWDASLTKVNLQNGIYGEYMFYFIQLVHDLGKNMYIVTTQFGRIGEEGANQRSPFNSLEDAKEEFDKIFKSKTGNSWEDRNNFERKKGKYMLLNYNKIQLKPNELLKPFDYEKCPKSKINNKEIHSLLKAFTDSSIIAKAFKESGVDTQFFNFSMLNKEILLKARNYLMELYKKVQELEQIRKININAVQNKSKNKKDKDNVEDNDDDNNQDKMDIDEESSSKSKNSKSKKNVKKEKEKNNKEIKDKNEIKTQKDKIEAIISKTNEIMILSSRYYELIPKEKYRNQCILPFDKLEEVKKEIQIIDNLTYVEKAVNILLGANNRILEINPLDYIYYSLQTYFQTLEKESSEFETIQKYINNTSNNDKIINIFNVTRKGETERINAFKNLPNHYLLFHGTKIFNLIGIFSNGLKIAPPEAPMTGYLFGKGIYLADMYEKSINYCDIFIDKSNPKKIKTYSFILLCEAALGKIYKASNNDLDVENLPFLKEGYNSLKSCSFSGPDLNKNFICNNGITIPLGNIIQYSKNLYNNNMFNTEHPEYIVYDTSQIKIRYIVQVERNGNDYY